MAATSVEHPDLVALLVRHDDAAVLQPDAAFYVAEQVFVGAVEQTHTHQRLVGEDQVRLAGGIALHDGLRNDSSDCRCRFSLPVLVASSLLVPESRLPVAGNQHVLDLVRRQNKPQETFPKPNRSQGVQLVGQTLRPILGHQRQRGVRVVL